VLFTDLYGKNVALCDSFLNKSVVTNISSIVLLKQQPSLSDCRQKWRVVFFKRVWRSVGLVKSYCSLNDVILFQMSS
jgi:hypothetical protein